MAMDQSILNSVKKVLGLDASYTAFDQDILTGINTALSAAQQLGVGRGYIIDNEDATWYNLEIGDTNSLNLLRTYVNLRCRLLFDPPTTSFLKDAFEAQLKEYEWRLSHEREYALYEAENEDIEITDEYVVFDGGTPEGSESPPPEEEITDEYTIIDGGTP